MCTLKELDDVARGIMTLAYWLTVSANMLASQHAPSHDMHILIRHLTLLSGFCDIKRRLYTPCRLFAAHLLKSSRRRRDSFKKTHFH